MGGEERTSAPPSLRVHVFNGQSDLFIHEQAVQKLVQHVFSFFEVQADEVAIHFIDEEHICSLHEEFFGDPSVTDCISFPIDQGNREEGMTVLGDVFVHPQMVFSSWARLPFNEELALYIIHGCLHLLGYADGDPLMEEKQNACLQAMNELQLCTSLASKATPTGG